jgi:hypothetical protein
VTGAVRVIAQGKSWTVKVKNGVATKRLPAFRWAGKKTVKVVYLSDSRNNRVVDTTKVTVRRR